MKGSAPVVSRFDMPIEVERGIKQALGKRKAASLVREPVRAWEVIGNG